MRLATTEEELAHAKERIAALEKDVKDLTADVSSRGKAIIALEAENEMLLKRLDDAQNGEGALIRENERLRALLSKHADSIERTAAYAETWLGAGEAADRLIGFAKEVRAALAGRGK